MQRLNLRFKYSSSHIQFKGFFRTKIDIIEWKIRLQIKNPKHKNLKN